MDRLIIHNIFNRYAGWLGSVAARYEENGKLSEVIPSLEEGGHRLAVIAGTSTCHLVQVHICSLSSEPITADFDLQRYRVPKVSSWMAYGVLSRYIRLTFIDFSTFLRKKTIRTQLSMDGGWPKVANHQLDRFTSCFFFFFVYLTIIRS